MAAEIHLCQRGKPADMISLTFRHEEGGLGKVVLVCDGLHGMVREPFFKGAYRGRVSFKLPGCKGVHLI